MYYKGADNQSDAPQPISNDQSNDPSPLKNQTKSVKNSGSANGSLNPDLVLLQFNLPYIEPGEKLKYVEDDDPDY